MDKAVHHAAFNLLETRPAASAGRRLAPPAVLLVGPGVFVAGLALLAPTAFLLTGLSLVYGYILLLVFMRLGAACLKPRYSPQTTLAPTELPNLTVIVALYREAEVVAGLCAGLSRLDYPKDRLDILLVLEAGDTQTIAAAKAAARRHGMRVVVTPPRGPQTKPRALNYALLQARGELVAVYDAEDMPSRNQLIAAAQSFAADPALGVVQAPLGWYNRDDCWLTRQFALEYAAQFHAILPLFSRLRMPLPLGGTSNVFRTSALWDVGAWDPFNVTEDADLGFRLARHGWTAGLIEPGTGEEAPTHLNAWTAQRSRWLKGHLVTWLVQMRQPRGLVEAAGWRALLGLQLSLLANVFSALAQLPGLLAAIFGLALLGLGQAGPLTIVGLAIGVAALNAAQLCLWISARRAGVRCKLSDLISAPLYWLCQLPAAWRALKELGSQTYVWAKTRHGVSTTRREAPDDPDRHLDPDGCDSRPVRVQRLALQPAR